MQFSKTKMTKVNKHDYTSNLLLTKPDEDKEYA